MSRGLTVLAALAAVALNVPNAEARDPGCAEALASLKREITDFGLVTEKVMELKTKPAPRDEVVRRREKRETLRLALANAVRSYLRAHRLARDGEGGRCLELVEEGRSYLPG